MVLEDLKAITLVLELLTCACLTLASRAIQELVDFCSFVSCSFMVKSNFVALNMSEPWSAQSWANNGWQQSGWEDTTNQWCESDNRCGYDSRQSTLGKSQGDTELPSRFKPSKNYLDETLVYRSTLKRYIEPSAWSRAKGIAGKPVKLTDLTHKGIQEWMI